MRSSNLFLDTQLVGGCLAYISVAVIKLYDQVNLLRKVFNLGLWLQRARVHVDSVMVSIHGRAKAWITHGCGNSLELMQIGGRNGTLSLLKPQSPSPRTQSFNRAIFPNPSQTVPPAGDQVFKCMSLCGHSHSNHHRVQPELHQPHLKNQTIKIILSTSLLYQRSLRDL